MVLTPETDSPAGRVSARTIVADYEDEAALAELARTSGVVTFEFENVPASAVARLQPCRRRSHRGRWRSRRPRTASRKSASSRRRESRPPISTSWTPPRTSAQGLRTLGSPALLKTRREGYDGKGQVWVEREDEADAAFERIGRAPAILESRVAFRRELSIIAARGWDGAFAAYPLTENWHEDGVLRRSLAPADADAATHEAALRIARTTLERLDYVGVAGIELFDTADGLKVNEIAPACTIPATGRWTPARSTSSSSTSAPLPAGRWAPPRPSRPPR